MLKVKMLARHASPTGKMESGLEYHLPSAYAFELVKHGLAEFVTLAPGSPVNVTLSPTKSTIMETALREMRGRNHKIIDGPKKRK